MRVFAPPGGGGEDVLGGDCGGEDYDGLVWETGGCVPFLEWVCVVWCGVAGEIAKYYVSGILTVVGSVALTRPEGKSGQIRSDPQKAVQYEEI